MKKNIEIKEDVKNEMNFGPMVNPRFGSAGGRRTIMVSYPMDSIRVGDIFVAKNEDSRGFFEVGDKIEIVGIRPVSIGRGNEFKVKVNGQIVRFWVTGELETAIGSAIDENIEKENRMKNIIEIKEEVKIGNVILEEGDKIEVLKEDSTMTWRDFKKNPLPHEIGEFKIEYFNSLFIEGISISSSIRGKSLFLIGDKSTKIKIIPEESDVVTVFEDFNYGFKIALSKVGGVVYCYYRT